MVGRALERRGGSHDVGNPAVRATVGARNQLGYSEAKVRISRNGRCAVDCIERRISQSGNRVAFVVQDLELDDGLAIGADCGTADRGAPVHVDPLVWRHVRKLGNSGCVFARRAGCTSSTSGASGAGCTGCAIAAAAATHQSCSRQQACRSQPCPMRARPIPTLIKNFHIRLLKPQVTHTKKLYPHFTMRDSECADLGQVCPRSNLMSLGM